MSYENVDPDEYGDASSGISGPPLKLIGALAVVVLAVVFVLQNGQQAEIKFLWMGPWQRSTWIIIVVSILLGVLLDRIGSWWWRRSRQRDSS